MHWTLQMWSESGSFAMPDGTDVRHATSKEDVDWLFTEWAEEHPQVGSDERDAKALVWKGHLPDVTDQWPDYELTLGPRHGICWGKC